jgi:hypothetical protein
MLAELATIVTPETLWAGNTQSGIRGAQFKLLSQSFRTTSAATIPVFE